MNVDSRGISPVIGIALLIAVVVALAAVSGAMFLSLSEEPEPAPDVVLSMENGDVPASHVIQHEGGDELDGGRVELQGTVDSGALSGTALSAGDGEEVFATDDTIEVVWVGEDGTSYVLRTFEVDSNETVSEPDEGCPWVEDESDSGTTEITVDGITVDCDVTTDDDVTVQDGGTVIGDTDSSAENVDIDNSTVYGDTVAEKAVDGDDATFYGSVRGGKVVNIQSGSVSGSITSEISDVKLNNATVGGSATGEKVVELQKGSTVAGDTTSTTKQVKILDDSVVGGDAVSQVDQVKVEGTVRGDVTGDTVELDGATIEGDVYVDSADFDCTDSTIDGKDCDDYSPKDPNDY